MKNIIVAIDFSDCSINALEHAITIADKGGFRITMVWVNNPTTTKILLAGEHSAELVNEIENQFRKLVEKYSPQLFPNHLFYTIREGKVYQEVARLATELNAMLIVAGTHGASGFEEFWVGSNTNRIISVAPCPVITIRAGISVSRDLKRIVMPVDSTPETRQKVDFTSEIARLFNAEVFVLALYTTGIKAIQQIVDGYAEQVAGILSQLGIKTHIDRTHAKNIATTTIDYAKQKDANLISIMTEQETTTSNLWLGPFAQQIVNNSPIPVLSIKPTALDISIGY